VKGAQSSWCKGTQGGRGMCTAIFKRQGAYILTWATTQTTVAHYKLCVTSPKGKRRCDKRPTKSLGDGVVGETVIFAREFPHNLDGRYGVAWRVGGKQIGPVLHFSKH
jgi:hypothetical protein